MADFMQFQYDYTVEMMARGNYHVEMMSRLVVSILIVVWRVGLSISRELRPMESTQKPRGWQIVLQSLGFGNLMFIMLAQLGGFDPTRVYLYSLMSTETEQIIRLVGALILTLGIVCSIWTRYIRGETWAPASWHPNDVRDHKLVTGGPYSIVRHPAYLSMWLIFLGFQLTMFSGLVVVALLMVIGMLRQAVREDKELEGVYEDEYRVYKTRTPFFLPIPHKRGA